LSERLIRQERPERVGHFTSGRLDLRVALQARLRQTATGKRSERLFTRPGDPKALNHRVVIAADVSPSMADKRDQVEEAFVLTLDGFGELGVPCAALGFAYDAKLIRGLNEEPTPADKGRELLALPWGEQDTNDYDALCIARDLLARERADKKVIIVITDGAGKSITSTLVRQLEKKHGAVVVGVGVGPDCSRVRDTYRHFVEVPDIARMVPELANALGDLLGGRPAA
jgi:nitric oxide reductase activation protein